MPKRRTVELNEDLHKILNQLRVDTNITIKKEVDRILRKELIKGDEK